MVFGGDPHALGRRVGIDIDGPTGNRLLAVFGISGGDGEGLWDLIKRGNSQTRFNFAHCDSLTWLAPLKSDYLTNIVPILNTLFE